MAVELGRAVYSLVTDSTKFEAGLDKAEQKTSSLGSKLGGLRTAVGIAAGAFASFAGGALSDFAEKANEDEASVAQLRSVVEASGVVWDDYTPKLDAAIKHGQDLAYSDDQTRAALSALTLATGDANKALELQNLTMDLARAKHIDLQTAAEVVGKVAAGNTGILTRYGIVLDKNATAEDALAAIHARTADAAAKYGATNEAWTLRVRDAVSEYAESIGYALGPATGLIALLPGLSSGMTLAGSAVGGVASMIKGPFIASLMSSLPAIGATIVALGPILIPLAAIAAAIALLALAWSNNWGDIQGKAKAVMDFITGAIEAFQRDGLGGLLAYLGNFVGEAEQALFNVGLGIVNGLMDGLRGLAGAVWNALVSAFSAIDFWVGPFHVTSSGVSISLPSISLPFQPAATGFEGVVAKPTLFMVAEREPEYVSVTPGGASSPSSSAGADAGHGHDIVMDGQLVATLVGRRYVRGAAAAGGAIG